MGKNTPIPSFLVASKVIQAEASRMAAIEAVKFFRESFIKQGFTDNAFNPWQKSTNPFSGKRTLFKSGDLRNSITKEISGNKLTVISDTKYSEIHNEGGFIVVTDKMKRYFWFRYRELNKKGKKADFCKAMALKPAGSKIKIPKRQFIGNSRALMRHLEGEYIRLHNREMFKAFKSLKF